MPWEKGPGSSIAVLVVMFRLSSQCADVILGWESGALSTLCFLNIEIGILGKNCEAWRLAALLLDHTKLCREFVTFYSK